MEEPLRDKHYEEKFEFPLWKLIKQRAEEKDISYSAAADELLPEYDKDLRFEDIEFMNTAVKNRLKEMADRGKLESKDKKFEGEE